MYTVPKVTFQNEELFISLVTLPLDFVSLKELGEDVSFAPGRTCIQRCLLSAGSVHLQSIFTAA